MAKTELKKKYDWKLTAKKVAISAGIILVTGAISVWQSEPWYLAIAPVLVGVLDWLKHKN